MLRLKKLRFSGIGRFADEQIIDFEELCNLIQVDGLNNNTGGSSGAGKSTVFHILDWLLGFSHKPNTVLKCRFSEEGMFAEGTFDYDGKPLVITRGKKLKIVLPDETFEGSSKLTEEKLDEILGIPRELFRKILHKRQKEGGFFLKMTPKEINEFLMSCLGLGYLKKKIEILDGKDGKGGKLKELYDKKASNATSLENAKASFKATQEAILALGLAPIRDIDQAVILQLKEKMDKAVAAHKVILAQQKTEVDALEVERPVIKAEPFDRTAIVAREKQRDDLNKQLRDLQQAEKDRQALVNASVASLKVEQGKLASAIEKGQKSKIEAQNVALEIKKIREQLCPTCEQGWATDKAKEKETELLAKLKSLKEDMTAANAACLPALEVTGKIKELEPQLKSQPIQGLTEITDSILAVTNWIQEERQKETNHQGSIAAKNNAILKEFATKQKELSDKHILARTQTGGQVDIDTRTFDAAIGRLKAFQEASTRYEKSLSSLKAQEEKYSLNVSELTNTSIQIHNELAKAEEIKRALKSFLSCSFDDALETISENSTKLIRNIPNMANATIQLEGEKETQDGKIKDEVNAVIHMDGEENVDLRSLCGGESTAADLAIDLSVIELVENRANKGIDIFILDEPFDGLDTVCIEMALEVLKSSSLNKRLVIVDHNPEVKQMVESKLLVTRTGPSSKVSQV